MIDFIAEVSSNHNRDLSRMKEFIYTSKKAGCSGIKFQLFKIDKLFATSHPYYCPHGRPIIINLSLDDLDKRFERH